MRTLLVVALLLTAAAPASAQQCVPECRSGFLCHLGQCVSACNPPCAANEECTSAGACVPMQQVAPPPQQQYAPPQQLQNTPPEPQQYAPPPQPQQYAPPPQPQGGWVQGGPPAGPMPMGMQPGPVRTDTGWAGTAGILGCVSAAGALILALASEATKEEQNPSLPLGITATITLGVMGPITAIGAASSRPAGGAGSPGLRIAGWIGYGLTMVDALYLISIGAEGVEPGDGIIASVGVLGAVSLLFFSIDAFSSTGGPPATAAAPSLRPQLALRPTSSGGVDVLGGLSATF